MFYVFIARRSAQRWLSSEARPDADGWSEVTEEIAAIDLHANSASSVDRKRRMIIGIRISGSGRMSIRIACDDKVFNRGHGTKFSLSISQWFGLTRRNRRLRDLGGLASIPIVPSQSCSGFSSIVRSEPVFVGHRSHNDQEWKQQEHRCWSASGDLGVDSGP